jgi:hypothetical protein
MLRRLPGSECILARVLDLPEDIVDIALPVGALEVSGQRDLRCQVAALVDMPGQPLQGKLDGSSAATRGGVVLFPLR